MRRGISEWRHREPTGSDSIRLEIILLVIFIVALVLGGYYFFFGGDPL
jgi:hypothetical protein